MICGAILAEHADAILAAHLTLVLLSTSVADEKPAIGMFRKVQALKRRPRFVLSLVEPSATALRRETTRERLREAASATFWDDVLDRLFCQTVLTRRVPLRDAMDKGGTAFSSDATRVSRGEFEAIFDEILALTKLRVHKP